MPLPSNNSTPTRDNLARWIAHEVLAQRQMAEASSIPQPSVPYSVHDQYLKYLVSGGLLSNKSLSPVRRFFALFVTFDILFTVLVWLITTLIQGLPLVKAFELQVINYTIKLSLFDIMMMSAFRFLLLMTAYVICRLNHYIIVALTTFLSSGFLMAKVFLLTWPQLNNTMFVVLFILSSFILAWSEAWLLDFRVLPQEATVRDLLSLDSERTNLLGRSVFPNANVRNYSSGVHRGAAGSSTFYSPLESPGDSDNEDQKDRGDCSYEEECKQKGKEVMELAWDLASADGWEQEGKPNNDGDCVEARVLPNYGKLYKLTGQIDVSLSLFIEEMHHKVEDAPFWNPTVVDCKVLQKVDDYTDIIYHVSSEGAGGTVSSRDFVSLRYWEMREDRLYTSSGIAVPHSDRPPVKHFIRGQNGPTAWIVREIDIEVPEIEEGEEEPEVPPSPVAIEFTWMLNTSLRGWLPQYLLDQAIGGVMMDFIKYTRNHLVTIRNTPVNRRKKRDA